jgi:predicted dithiol-disulfide oxidoreductase (DUF899 family)
LSPGGTVPKNYAFISENGPASFSDLFGDKQTLAVQIQSHENGSAISGWKTAT